MNQILFSIQSFRPLLRSYSTSSFFKFHPTHHYLHSYSPSITSIAHSYNTSTSLTTFSNYINNTITTPLSSTHFTPITNPITGEIISQIPQESSLSDIHNALSCAFDAHQSWKSTSISSRSTHFYKLHSLLHQNIDTIALSISLELGKTFSDSKGDVLRGLESLQYAISSLNSSLLGTSSHAFSGGTSSNTSSVLDAVQIKESLGVTLGICPFNFPAMIPLWIIPVSLVVGNAVIIKPSQRTPGASHFLAECIKKSGFPQGLFQILHGGKSTVNALINATFADVFGENVKGRSSRTSVIQAVSFVGSSGVGREVYASASEKGIRVQCNLGAKNHGVLVVPLETERETVKGWVKMVVGAAFGASGQRCMALSVLIVVCHRENEKEYEFVMDVLKNVTESLRVGYDLMENGVKQRQNVDMGPVESDKVRVRVKEVLEEAEIEGGKVLVDGRKWKKAAELPENGFWIGPSVVSDVDLNMRVYKDEVFGPVLSVIRVEKVEEAIEIVNRNEYGNGASVFTVDGRLAKRFEREIDAGQIGINVPIPLGPPSMSFTGSKGSMLGDCQFYGEAGIRFFTKPKNIVSRWEYKQQENSQNSVPMDIPNVESERRA
mmetsp:Transcript_11026/g.19931  ORF Transcript_11026/g.19931 Transcript_11026/m.19931 type:complete len:606 (-) Transcript_11026:462-2279(-)